MMYGVAVIDERRREFVVGELDRDMIVNDIFTFFVIDEKHLEDIRIDVSDCRDNNEVLDLFEGLTIEARDLGIRKPRLINENRVSKNDTRTAKNRSSAGQAMMYRTNGQAGSGRFGVQTKIEAPIDYRAPAVSEVPFIGPSKEKNSENIISEFLEKPVSNVHEIINRYSVNDDVTDNELRIFRYVENVTIPVNSSSENIVSMIEGIVQSFVKEEPLPRIEDDKLITSVFNGFLSMSGSNFPAMSSFKMEYNILLFDAGNKSKLRVLKKYMATVNVAKMFTIKESGFDKTAIEAPLNNKAIIIGSSDILNEECALMPEELFGRFEFDANSYIGRLYKEAGEKSVLLAIPVGLAYKYIMLRETSDKKLVGFNYYMIA